VKPKEGAKDPSASRLMRITFAGYKKARKDSQRGKKESDAKGKREGPSMCMQTRAEDGGCHKGRSVRLEILHRAGGKPGLPFLWVQTPGLKRYAGKGRERGLELEKRTISR